MAGSPRFASFLFISAEYLNRISYTNIRIDTDDLSSNLAGSFGFAFT